MKKEKNNYVWDLVIATISASILFAKIFTDINVNELWHFAAILYLPVGTYIMGQSYRERTNPYELKDFNYGDLFTFVCKIKTSGDYLCVVFKINGKDERLVKISKNQINSEEIKGDFFLIDGTLSAFKHLTESEI